MKDPLRPTWHYSLVPSPKRRDSRVALLCIKGSHILGFVRLEFNCRCVRQGDPPNLCYRGSAGIATGFGKENSDTPLIGTSHIAQPCRSGTVVIALKIEYPKYQPGSRPKR